MNFLAEIRPLLTDLKIGVYSITPYHLENLHTILTHLSPMLDGIPSVCCDNESALPVAKEQLFRENEKLSELKMLNINFFPETGSSH